MDLVKIKVWVPNQVALKEVLGAAEVSCECGSPKSDGSGNFIVTLYAPKAEAEKVTSLQYKTEIDEHYGDVLEERQKEVSQTDRFKGGKVKPKGLGVKR